MKKLLVIDDQTEILEIVADILEAEGYRVVTASNGVQGFEMARRYRPDLILCDIMMPGMNGYDVLQATRRDLELATTPFIFLTAKAGPEDLRTGMTLGADDYLVKPFDHEELLAAVRTQLEKNAAIRKRFLQQIELLRQGLSTILPHELRTPLTLILAHTSLLLETGMTLDRASMMDMIRTIHESGLRLHRLLENLLVYVSMEGDSALPLENPLTTNARFVIVDAATRRAEAHRRPSDLTTTVVDGTLRLHPFHLRKIIEELVDNSFKFSQSGESVEVIAANDDGMLYIEVVDRGRGMTQEQIEAIGAYVQFKRYIYEQQGSGVGLTLVRRLIEIYDGELKIESTPDRGTKIQVWIPHVWVEPVMA